MSHWLILDGRCMIQFIGLALSVHLVLDDDSMY